jgi:nicotinamide phosphoribosyltransferase
MFGMSIAVATDSYKASHAEQYPKKTRRVTSHMVARGSKIADYILWYGIYYYLKKYLAGVVITKTDVDKAEKFWNAHFGYNVFKREHWDYIVENHGGKLPVRIRAVKEGTKVGNHNVLMIIENTDDKCWWLTNFIETLLMKVWYTSTVATNSAEIRKTILQYLEETGTPGDIWFKCHDFGYRGVSSEETAALGGSAHLLSFMGTDTVAGIFLAQDVYNTEEMIGFSVPASEHSTITSWGKVDEVKAFENMLDTYPEGIVACVSDSFHILEAIDKWGTLKHKIETRKGRLVIRPDSGDPARTDLAVIEKIGSIFGYTVNAKGYKVLPDYIRVIQGDGVSRTSIAHILETLKNAGWSADNIGFGSGGKLIQDFNRDDFNFAIKCCEVDVDGEIRYIDKTPVEINENGELVFSFKTSKKGNMKLVKDGDGFRTVTALDADYDFAKDEMEVIFENGEILVHPRFEDIRARATA